MTLPLHFLTHYQIWHNQFANCFVFCPQKFIFTSSKSVKRATCAIIFARKSAMKWSGLNCNFPAIVIIWNIMSADFRVATKSLDFHLRPSHAHTQIMHGNKNKYGSYHINYHEFVGTVYANGALIIIFSGKKRAWTGWEMSLSLTAVFSVHEVISYRNFPVQIQFTFEYEWICVMVKFCDLLCSWRCVCRSHVVQMTLVRMMWIVCLMVVASMYRWCSAHNIVVHTVNWNRVWNSEGKKIFLVYFGKNWKSYLIDFVLFENIKQGLSTCYF